MSASIFLHSGETPRKYSIHVARPSGDSYNATYIPVTIRAERAEVSLFFGCPDNLRHIASMLMTAAIDLEKALAPRAAQPTPAIPGPTADLPVVDPLQGDPSATITHADNATAAPSDEVPF